jgi:hypothetical protein
MKISRSSLVLAVLVAAVPSAALAQFETATVSPRRNGIFTLPTKNPYSSAFGTFPARVIQMALRFVF